MTDENRANADRQRAKRTKRNLEKGSGSSRRPRMTREETEAARQEQIEALRRRFGS